MPARKAKKQFARMQALMRHLTVLFGAPPLFALRVCVLAIAAGSGRTRRMAASEAEAFCPVRARRYAGARHAMSTGRSAADHWLAGLAGT